MAGEPGRGHSGADRERLQTWLLSLLCVLAGGAVLWLLWRLVQAVAPVLVVASTGALLAVLLGPLADRLQRAIRSRALAALAMVLLLLAPFVLLGAWLVVTVLREAQSLLTHLPQIIAAVNVLLSQAQSYLSARFGVHVDLTRALGASTGGGTGPVHFDLAHALQNVGGGVLRGSVNVLSGIATVTADTVVVLVVAFFLIWDGDAMARSLSVLLPTAWQSAARDVGRILSTVVVDYVRGQFLVALVFGTIVGVSMALLGLPDAALLGFLSGLFELLPTVGPILASAGPVLLSLALQPFPHVIWVLAVLIGAQQLESNFLVPRISGGLVGLHPLTVILAVFGGWTLAGLTGALLAVPAVGVTRELLRYWWQPTMPSSRPRLWPAPGVPARRRGEAAPTPAAAEGPPVPAEPPPPPAPTRPPVRAQTRRQRQRG